VNWLPNLKRELPNAIPFKEAYSLAESLLAKRGLFRENTLFGVSACLDELNSPAIDLATLNWGERFTLSGLGGFPISGLTGMAAFMSHVPDNGHLYIIYGPHIGIDDHGVLGQTNRCGMTAVTTCCGALATCLAKYQADNDYRSHFNELDMAQYIVESKLIPNMSLINAMANPILGLTELAYLEIEKMIKEVMLAIETEADIYLLGGIFVNVPLQKGDYFVPKNSLYKNPQNNSFEEGWFS